MKLPKSSPQAFVSTDYSLSHHSERRVNIGVPVLNGQHTLARTLGSLLNQNFENIRIIVTDNGSTDGTPDIVKEFCRMDHRVEYYKFSRGPVEESFARSLELADSSHFMWAAADDFWSPSFLDACFREMTPDVSFVWPNWWVGDLDDGVGTSAPMHPFPYASHPNPRYRTLSFVNTHHLAHKCNIVYSLFETNLIREAYKRQDISDDGALGAVLLSSGKCGLVNEVNFYKHFPSSAMNVDHIQSRWIPKIVRNRRGIQRNFFRHVHRTRRRLTEHFPEWSVEIDKIHSEIRLEGPSPVISSTLQLLLSTEIEAAIE